MLGEVEGQLGRTAEEPKEQPKRSSAGQKVAAVLAGVCRSPPSSAGVAAALQFGWGWPRLASRLSEVQRRFFVQTGRHCRWHGRGWRPSFGAWIARREPLRACLPADAPVASTAQALQAESEVAAAFGRRRGDAGVACCERSTQPALGGGGEWRGDACDGHAVVGGGGAVAEVHAVLCGRAVGPRRHGRADAGLCEPRPIW